MRERAEFLHPQAVVGFIRWAAIFVAAGAALYLGAVVWSGWAAVLDALISIGFPALFAGAAIAGATYILRFGRWHLALSWLNSQVPWVLNLRIYLAGLALTTSPGKLGETFRSVLLLPHGVPVSRSLGTFLADRLSDVIGVSLLGGIAGLLQDGALNAAAIGGVIVGAGSFVWRAMMRYRFMENFGDRLPRWARRSSLLAIGAMQEWASLWRPHRVFFFTCLALLAYGVQAGVFAWYCSRLGLHLPVAQAVEIFANATLLGAASMVPGGLGTMEAALVAQLIHHGADMPVAVSVAIAVRLVTLWTGVLIGVLSLLSLASQMNNKVCR